MSVDLRTSEKGAATFSPDGVYRYDLTRGFDGLGTDREIRDDDRLALWVMLNPSTADENVLDPTLRRVRMFTYCDESRRLSGFVVCNLYAFRATKPKDLVGRAGDVEGSENAATVARWLADRRVKLVVAGWGAHGRNAKLPRSSARSLVEDHAVYGPKEVVSLGLTATGEPRHPLYVSGSTPFEAWLPPR